MTHKDREKIFKGIWDRNKKVRETKGVDYADSNDVNANFKRSAERYNTSPEKVLMILVDKHLDAMRTYVNKGCLKGEPIRAKADDVINYIGIFESLVDEKENSQNS